MRRSGFSVRHSSLNLAGPGNRVGPFPEIGVTAGRNSIDDQRHPPIAGERAAYLFSIIDRIEALHALREAKADEIADVYREMRAAGFSRSGKRPSAQRVGALIARQQVFAPLEIVPRRLAATRVYFLAAETAGLIKIGCSHQPDRRTRDLQVTSPIGLKVLAVISGGRKRERELHHQFAHLRAHGEWFRSAPDLLAFIAEAGQ